ncbi:MAG TPA: ergothioneine biosynthesis protein EgtB [Polyangiaceae bacterium]
MIDPAAEEVLRRYLCVRARTEALAAPLSAEDAMVQSMPDASPAKWHLAHTTWFFAEFVLAPFEGGGRGPPLWPDERWRVLFNSYYEAVGPRHVRAARGVLSRPSLDEVQAWRAAVDTRMAEVIPDLPGDALAAALLGTHHEEQHQELLLTDAKHALHASELRPSYLPRASARAPVPAPALRWADFSGGVVAIGHAGQGFAFDNEAPSHEAFVAPFRLASRLVTNAEYRGFVEDGGYRRPDLWLSDGWAAAQAACWTSPLYWEEDGAAFGMHGVEALDPAAPVAHVSHYEADAYARWSGARLPTEHEWEHAAHRAPVEGNFVDDGRLAPAPAPAGEGVTQAFGDAWEWTASAYLPYPRFRTAPGALGEYNGKFMSGQMVLRGGSCFSARDHLRATYRNFFPPGARWQVTGIRLARDA